MTSQEATIVVVDHLRWLEENDRVTIAQAFKIVFFNMGGLVMAKDKEEPEEEEELEGDELEEDEDEEEETED